MVRNGARGGAVDERSGSTMTVEVPSEHWGSNDSSWGDRVHPVRIWNAR